jgi:hypothetical protein
MIIRCNRQPAHLPHAQRSKFHRGYAYQRRSWFNPVVCHSHVAGADSADASLPIRVPRKPFLRNGLSDPGISRTIVYGDWLGMSVDLRLDRDEARFGIQPKRHHRPTHLQGRRPRQRHRLTGVVESHLIVLQDAGG